MFLGAPLESLVPPADGEVYLHELVGFAVRSRTDEALGIVSDLHDYPQGLTLEVQGPKREFLLPYRKEFVVEVDRIGRRLVVELPDGLLDL
jgi:16S rRNA processing protein RimM